MVDSETMVEVLVTGGAGFIGSNFVLHALTTHPDWQITTLDKLTYAGRRENLRDVMNDPRHRFVQGDVTGPSIACLKNTMCKPDVSLRGARSLSRSLARAWTP